MLVFPGMNCIIFRDNRKSQNYGSRDFRDFCYLPRLLPNAVICRDFCHLPWFLPNAVIFAICHDFYQMPWCAVIFAICHDFYQMPWFAVILLISPNSQYLLSINCNLHRDYSATSQQILSTSSVASCTPIPKFTHFSYILTKQMKSLFCQCWTKHESLHISQCASTPEFHRPKPSTSCYDVFHC